MLSHINFTFLLLWSGSFSALLFLFATPSIGNAELATEDLAFLGTDSTEQSSLIDWLPEDTGVAVLGIGNPDIFSPEAEPDLKFAGTDPLDSQYSGLSSGDSLFTTDQSVATEVPSVQTGLDLTSLDQESAPEAECLVDGVGILDKRQTCGVDLANIRGSNPGLCPKFMNNIRIITCCCENAVEYDPETYPTFKPCYECKYDGFYLYLFF